jgi:hypothetical protein
MIAYTVLDFFSYTQFAMIGNTLTPYCDYCKRERPLGPPPIASRCENNSVLAPDGSRKGPMQRERRGDPLLARALAAEQKQKLEACEGLLKKTAGERYAYKTRVTQLEAHQLSEVRTANAAVSQAALARWAP